MAGVADFTQFVDVRARDENPRFATNENDGSGLALGKFIQNQIETLHLPEPEYIDLRIRVIEYHPRNAVGVELNSRGFRSHQCCHSGLVGILYKTNRPGNTL